MRLLRTETADHKTKYLLQAMIKPANRKEIKKVGATRERDTWIDKSCSRRGGTKVGHIYNLLLPERTS